ncbi:MULTISPECIES: hypothetical protein [Flavobacterium]|uniref:Uncharacterized protein n=1 Tax=Flavobacterium covae TaxID=2906076 RepID=A0ABW8PDR3_9FLAO|nr:hypothetical protein [Flavobacterium covae]OXA82834.1 hypothetical protein B0A56_03755 [Flavobacterium columnare NBRC 100251 = ATCC 23463]POR23832.1 hypothetical protein BWK57_00565 [Flavobacterium columnare]AMA50253.1 hypothetical protein AWN65_12680 [Flavobacterium covae]MCJ1807104.1 hypothetical protein [Flavobacterium covae]MCJ1809334.1 hypothetical protein [Flavobacterium covae]
MRRKNQYNNYLLIIILATKSIFAIAPAPPPPIKRALPPGTFPIDDHLLILILSAILLSFYFLRKSIKKAPKV